MKERFNVTGMTCSACSSRVEKAVEKLEGVQTVSVNLLTNSMQVEFDERKLQTDGIVAAVEKAGYGASSESESKGSADVSQNKNKKSAERVSPVNLAKEQAEAMRKRLIVSFLFLIPLMYVSMGHMVGLPLPKFLTGHENGVSFAFTQLLLCLPILYVNRAYYTRGFKNLFRLSPNMDSLIALGSAASLVYGIFAIYRMSYGLGHGDMELVARYHMDLYFESAAMILALINLGKYFEAKSKGKTSEALDKLISLAPKTAIVLRGGTETEILVEDVVQGDTVIVKPGSAVPVDGVVLEGVSNVDESAITGESIPVFKEAGSQVIGATTNMSGFLKIQATKVGEDTTFSQIIKLVEEASASKAPIAKLADKIAGIFVPVVITIALVTGVAWMLSGATFEFALSCAICVLVISCPCALGLATPVAIMVGTGKGAENGILIKSGEALEIAHNVDTVVLDKTGTITEGKPKVTDILSDIPREKLLKIAGALEEKSEHPLAEAIMAYIKSETISYDKAENFHAVPGQGIEAVINGEIYFAGNAQMLKEHGISQGEYREKAEELAEQGKTPLFFADENRVLGVIAVADTVKPTSREAISQLKHMGIRVVMLTGDNKKTAEGIGRNLDLDEIVSEVLPQDKEQVVSRLQQSGTVAMVGDGINDAPALVKADVGIAIGSGTDVAVESADVILMKNDLLDVVTAIRLSKAVIRNIKQNLFWAFFYNALGIPLAAGVLYPVWGLKLSPMFGAAAMGFSSVFVVSNALRLKLFQSLKAKSEPSHDEAITKIEEKESKNMTTLKISGMMCPHCVAHVTEALNKIEGVKAQVSLEEKQAVVEGDVAAEVLVKAVEDAGYKVTEVL